MIEITGVSLNYNPVPGKEPELENVNLSIEEGEFVVIIGPSGCGKSSILNMIAGFNQPTEGTVLVEGEKVTDPSPRRGMVFQSVDAPLFDWLTTRQNIGFGLRGKGPERKQIIEKYLRMVQLEGSGDKFPSELSGGMKQRVQLARIWALDPVVLLMDEPFANLDAITRDIMQDELQNLWLRTKKTVVYVTHSITEGVVLGQRIFLMTAGPRARIKREVSIPLEYPRDALSEEVLRFERELHGEIDEEVRKTMQAGGLKQ